MVIIAELKAFLAQFPDDYEVLINDYGVVKSVAGMGEWLHFQTAEPMGGILLWSDDDD